MTSPTTEEALMLTALAVISRGKPECTGCRWSSPCDKCFAAQVWMQVVEGKRFVKWKKSYRLVAKRPKESK